jgi:hypothetical protein
MQRRGMVLSRIIVAFVPLLAACTLIDQRTFNPNAGVMTKVAVAPGPAPIPPLVVVDFAKPNPDYEAALLRAVNDAVGRKPDVQFDVVTVVPATGTIAQQAAAATGLVPDAREVARAINRDGVDDDRIHLTARTDASVATRQVQVFVR